jgi:predicted AAA+ superfamily ATPase
MKIPSPFHQKLIEWLRTYMATGGMPEAVKQYIENNSVIQSQQELASILQTFRDDFSKYRKRIHVERLRMTLDRLPGLIGRKLKYVDISREERAKDLQESIDMLRMAQIVYCVHHSSGNAIPLRAEANSKDYKPLFLDIGLMMWSLGLQITDLIDKHVLLANKGAVAEQFIGQQLLHRHVGNREPELFYWNREKRNSSAQVDYLIPIGGEIVPVEVKAGKTGSLKSLHVFATEKEAGLAVRFNLDTPSLTCVTSRHRPDAPHEFRLLSLPIYMVSETERLCRSC